MSGYAVIMSGYANQQNESCLLIAFGTVCRLTKIRRTGGLLRQLRFLALRCSRGHAVGVLLRQWHRLHALRRRLQEGCRGTSCGQMLCLLRWLHVALLDCCPAVLLLRMQPRLLLHLCLCQQ